MPIMALLMALSVLLVSCFPGALKLQLTSPPETKAPSGLVIESLPPTGDFQDKFLAFRWCSPDAPPLGLRLRVPRGLKTGSLSDAPDRRYPLVVFLNGSGVSGTDNRRQLSPPALSRFVGALRNPDALVLVPQCPWDIAWDTLEWKNADGPVVSNTPSIMLRSLFAAIDEIERIYPVDSSRRYLLGHSLGGFGAYQACVERPHFFAACVVVAGGFDPAAIGACRDTAFRVYHGARDANVPVEQGRRMAAALGAEGMRYIYTEYPDAGHDILPRVLTDDELVPWLYASRLP
jgi:predicted peptidase